MKFECVYSFPVPLADLERALLDPSLCAELGKNVRGYKEVSELERNDQGAKLVRRVRFQAKVEIPSFARSKIKPEMTGWVEESSYDRERHSMTFVVRPTIPERWNDRFSAHGTEDLRENGGQTTWSVRGEVVLKVSLIGGIAERFIVGEFKKNYDDTAQVLRTRV